MAPAWRTDNDFRPPDHPRSSCRWWWSNHLSISSPCALYNNATMYHRKRSLVTDKKSRRAPYQVFPPYTSLTISRIQTSESLLQTRTHNRKSQCVSPLSHSSFPSSTLFAVSRARAPKVNYPSAKMAVPSNAFTATKFVFPTIPSITLAAKIILRAMCWNHAMIQFVFARDLDPLIVVFSSWSDRRGLRLWSIVLLHVHIQTIWQSMFTRVFQ